MCRFLAYVGPPRSLDELLVTPEHSLMKQSWAPRMQKHGTVNADGFGVGWYDLDVRPEPARYRAARPMWADRSFCSLAGVVQSAAVLAAVRSATPPAPLEESGTPPFTSGEWLFAHNGAVDGFRDELGGRLRRTLSDRRASAIEGAADSEVLFAMVLDRLDAGASPMDALRSVVAEVLACTTARLNMVVLDGRSVTAVAGGDSLFVRNGSDGGSGVTVASEPSECDEEWEAVPEGAVVCASATKVTVSP